MSTLDDLLKYEDEPPPKPTSHRERPSRWLVKALLIAAIGTAAGYGVLRLAGVAVPPPFIFALLMALLLLRRVLRDTEVARIPETLRKPPGPQRSAAEDEEGGWDGRDGLELASATWYTRLSWLHSRTDPRQFVRTIQPRMVQLIDERLRLRHGVTLSGEPARARELLGEPLCTFVSQPVPKNPSPRELAALVKHVEDL